MIDTRTNVCLAFGLGAASACWLDACSADPTGGEASTDAPQGSNHVGWVSCLAPGCTVGPLTSCSSLTAMAVDADDVYMATVDSVRSVSKDGGAPVVLASSFPDHTSPLAIAVDATSVYWVTLCYSQVCSAGPWTAYLMKAPKGGGGNIVTLAETPTNEGGVALAVVGSSVYFAVGATLQRVPVDGGPVTVLGSAGGGVSSMVVSSSDLYLATPFDVERVSLTGGGSAVLSPSSGSNPTNLVIDSQDVYWGETGNGGYPPAILRAPLAGGDLSRVLLAPGGVGAIAVDTSRVYWSGSGGPGGGPNIFSADPNTGTYFATVTGLVAPAGLVLDETSLYVCSQIDASGVATLLKIAPK